HARSRRRAADPPPRNRIPRPPAAGRSAARESRTRRHRAVHGRPAVRGTSKPGTWIKPTTRGSTPNPAPRTVPPRRVTAPGGRAGPAPGGHAVNAPGGHAVNAPGGHGVNALGGHGVNAPGGHGQRAGPASG